VGPVDDEFEFVEESPLWRVKPTPSPTANPTMMIAATIMAMIYQRFRDETSSSFSSLSTAV